MRDTMRETRRETMRAACWLTCLFVLWLAEATVAAEPTSSQQSPQAVIQHFSEQDPASLSATDYLRWSQAYDRLVNKDAALTTVNKALELPAEMSLKFEAMLHKASVYGRLFRDTRKALDVLQQAEPLLAQLPQEQQLPQQQALFETFANAWNQLGDLPQASHYARGSLQAAQQAKLPMAEIDSRLILGRIVLQQNNYAEAQFQLSKALELALSYQENHQQDQEVSRRIQSKIGSIALRLGMAFMKLEQYQQAIPYLLQSQAIYQQLPVNSPLVTVALNLADSYRQLGQLDLAAAQLTTADQLVTQLDDPFLRAQLEFNQGMLAMSNQQLVEAEQRLNRSMQFFAQQSQQFLQLEVSLQLARLAMAQQQYAKADSLMTPVQEPEKLPMYLQQQWYDVLAELRASQHDWQAAYVAQQQGSQLRYRWVKQQEQQKLGVLQDQLAAPAVQQLKPLSNQSSTWTLDRGLALFSTLALLVVSMSSISHWRRRRQRATPTNLMPSWQSFCKQLCREHASQPQTLVAVQLNQLHSWKFKYGERRLRRMQQELLNHLPPIWQQQFTVHTDTLWLYGPTADAANCMAELYRCLPSMAQMLDSHCQFNIWSGDLADICGAQCSPEVLQSVRELVWCGWHEFSRTHGHAHIKMICPQPNPVSWMAENIRTDIENAHQLGLFKFYLEWTQPLQRQG